MEQRKAIKMKKVTFRFMMLIKCLKQNPLLNSVVFVSMVAGLFYPCFLIGAFNCHWSKVELCTKIDDQNFILAEIVTPFENEQKMRSTFENDIARMSNIGISALLIRTIAMFEKENVFAYVQGVDFTVLNNTDRLVSGRLPTKTEIQQNAPVAIVAIDLMQKARAKIGDSFTVNGKRFEIIGSILRSEIIGTVLIPYAGIEEVSQGAQLQYQVFLWGDGLTPSNVKAAIEKTYSSANITTTRTAKEFIDNEVATSNRATIIRLSRGLSTLLLSIFATMLVACGKLMSERKTIAIKLASGACRRDIIIDCIFEMLAFSITAVGIDLVIMYFSLGALSYIETLLFSWRLVALSLAMVSVFSLIIGLISGLAATKFNVAKLLQV